MSRESRLRRTPSCAARPMAYVAPARSITTTNRAATATGYGQPLQKSTGASVGRDSRQPFLVVGRQKWLPAADCAHVSRLGMAGVPAEARQTTSALCEERRRRQLPARPARETPKKEMEGVSQPATPSGPPSDQHPPGSKPQPIRNGSAGNPPSSGLAPKDRLTYLEHCGNRATTNSRRTIRVAPNRRSSQILPIWQDAFPMW
jgi:hypothetical protein